MFWLYILFLVRCSAEIDEKWIFCRNLPPKLIHGFIRRDRVSFYNGQGYLGSMEYNCFPGFNLLGDRLVVCQNGRWSSMPQCIAKQRCAKIDEFPSNSIIERENLIRSPTNFQEILAGSTISLRCADNYRFQTTGNRTSTIVCQPDGTWTVMDQCQFIQYTCDYAKLYLPARSRITRMNFQFSEHNRQFHRPGSSLEYTCEDGYRLHDGKTSLIVQCLPSGSWSPLPVCDFVDRSVRNQRCSYPRQIQNGSITAYNVTIWEDQSYTGQVIYHCDYGYETVSGTDEIISDCFNGTWTKVDDCQTIPTCSKEDLLSIESQAEHSYVHNVSLQYIRDPMAFIYNSYVLRVCLPNFVHDSNSSPLKIRCQRQTKTWTGVPICRPLVTTTTPKIIDSTSKEEPLISTLDENSILSVELSTSVSSTTQIIETTDALQCNVDEIPSIPDAVVDNSETNQFYPIGTTLIYVCLTSVSDYSSSTTCLIDGTWSTDGLNLTQCQIESNATPLVTTLEKTTNVIDDSTTTSLQSVTDSTDFDKYLPELNLTTESITSSTMKSAIVKRRVRHLSSFCLSVPQIEHGKILQDETVSTVLADGTTAFRGSIVASCQQGYRSNQIDEEPVRIRCENGQFAPKLICIEQPRCSLPPPIDSIESTIIMSQIQVSHTSSNEAIPGSFIVLQCSANDIFNMTCSNDGHWLSTPTKCPTSSKHRCQANVAIANARTKIHGKLNQDGSYTDGSRVIYQCLDNFIHDARSGPLLIECINGRWGPRPRCIPEGCEESLPDRIENGWKSAESFINHNQVKYYQLTRYTCNDGNVLKDSSFYTIDIECRQNQWQYKTLPKCAPI